MTNGDHIRSMTDEQLADFIANLMSSQRATIIEQLSTKGILADVCIIENPIMARVAHLQWLRQPVGETE